MKEILTNQARIDRYIKEYCYKCKNRKTELCHIKIFAKDRVIHTRCVFYEEEK